MFFNKDNNRITLALQGNKSNLPELIAASIDQDEKFVKKQYLLDKLIQKAAELNQLDKSEQDIRAKIKKWGIWVQKKDVDAFLSNSIRLCKEMIDSCYGSLPLIQECIKTSNDVNNEIRLLYSSFNLRNNEITWGFQTNNRRLETLLTIEKILKSFIAILNNISTICTESKDAESKRDMKKLMEKIDKQKLLILQLIDQELIISKNEDLLLIIDANMIKERFEANGLMKLLESMKKRENSNVRKTLAKFVLKTVLYVHLAGIGSSTYLFTHHMPIENSQVVNQEISKKISSQKQNITKESVVFKSKDGINLHGEFYKNPKADPSKAIVLIHGWAANKSQMLPFVEKYISSYNVFAYDSRGAGENDFNAMGLGYEERLDLVGALNMLSSKGIKEVVLQGLSMGAATIAFTLGEEKIDSITVKGVVLQSMYADQAKTQAHYSETLNHMPKSISVPSNWVLNLIKGKKLSDISALNEISKINVPILLVYNDKDPQLLDSDNNALSQEVSKKQNSQVMVVHGSEHVDMSVKTQQVVYNFIRNIF